VLSTLLNQGINRRLPIHGSIRFMQRDELFAGLSIVGCVNGLGADIVASVRDNGWETALINTFGVSAIVWFACFIGVMFILQDRQDELRVTDLVVGAVFILLVVLPIHWASWLALTVLSLYILFLTDGPSSRKRGAALLVAVTFPMAWNRVLMHFFAKPILEIDTLMVSSLLGTNQIGNMVSFADHSGYLVIFPACSSLTGVSLAILCWFTISYATQHNHSARDFLWCGLACASVILINVTRLTIMGTTGQHYEALHSEMGATMVNVITLIFVVGFCALGVRRELFSRI
jgi:hypothetical protein